MTPAPSSEHPRATCPTEAGWRPTPPELADRLCERLPPGLVPVLDPACGEGALLLAALRRAGNQPEYARSCLFGIESDRGRAERTRSVLRAAAGLPLGTELDEHIQCGDGLEREWPAGTWVIANPPWVSHSGRQAVARATPARAAAERSADSLPPADLPVDRRRAGWPSTHSEFLVQIARHLAREGTGALCLLPASLLDLEMYADCRREVEHWAHPHGDPIELGEDAFPGVIEPAALLELAPGGLGPDTRDRWSAPAPDWLAALRAHPRFPQKSFGDPGVHSGNTARELVLPADAADWPGLRQGRDLRAFRLGPPSARLRTDLEPSSERRFRFATLDRYRSIPILLRQTANRPIAAEHVEPTYFRNSLLACRPPSTLAIPVVVALLNGPVACAWHRATQRDGRQRSFPQVKVSALSQLPLPFADRSRFPRLHDRIAALSIALSTGPEEWDRREELDRLTLEAYQLEPSVSSRVLEVAAG